MIPSLPKTSPLPGEGVLAICPWLWAVRNLWSEGWSSQTGSHVNVRQFPVLEHRLEKGRCISFKIHLSVRRHGIWRVVTLPMNSPFDSLHQDTAPDLTQDGDTIAERIIANLDLSIYDVHRIVERREIPDIYVPEMVIEVEGYDERTEHFFICRDHSGSRVNWDKNPPNLLKTILEVAGDFRPRRFRQESNSPA